MLTLVVLVLCLLTHRGNSSWNNGTDLSSAENSQRLLKADLPPPTEPLNQALFYMLKGITSSQQRITSPYKETSDQSYIVRRCTTSVACDYPVGVAELQNVIFVKNELRVVSAANDETSRSVNEMNSFHGSKSSHLPSILAYVDNNKGEFVPGPHINFNAVDMKSTCPNGKWIDESIYFHAPWENHNGYHSINDNLFSVLSSLYLQMRTNPTNLPTTTTDRDREKLLTYLPKRLYVFKRLSSTGASVTSLYQILTVLFNNRITPAREILSSSTGTHCIRHGVWGTAMKPFYRDSLQLLRYASYELLQTTLAIYLHQTRPTVTPIDWAKTSFITKSPQSTPTPSNSTVNALIKFNLPRQPRIMIMSRNTTSTPSRKLTYETELQLQQYLHDTGFTDVIVCCDFKQPHLNTVDKFITYFHDNIDICIGIHGAGLGNCALGSPGMIMIELQTLHNYGFDSFMKITHMTRGHYAFYDLRPWVANGGNNMGKGGMMLTSAVLHHIVTLSISLWKYSLSALPVIEANVQYYLQHTNYQTTATEYSPSSDHRALAAMGVSRRKPAGGGGGGGGGKNVNKGRFADKAEAMVTQRDKLYQDEIVMRFPASTSAPVQIYTDFSTDNSKHHKPVQSFLKEFSIVSKALSGSTGVPTETVVKPLQQHPLYHGSTENYNLPVNHQEFMIYLNPYASEVHSHARHSKGEDQTVNAVFGPPMNQAFDYCMSLPYYKFKLVTRAWGDHYGNCDKHFLAMRRSGNEDNAIFQKLI